LVIDDPVFRDSLHMMAVGEDQSTVERVGDAAKL